MLGSTLASCSSGTDLSPTALSDANNTESLSTAAFESPLTIGGFVLIDADSDQPISTYNPLLSGTTLYLDQLPTNVNLIALASADTESVQFGLNASPSFRIENEPPYAIQGDDKGNYKPWQLQPGTYQITATAFSNNRATGLAGEPQALQFQVEATTPETPSEHSVITGIQLINADTDQPIQGYAPLLDGAVISLAFLPTRNLNILVETTSEVESVRFALNDQANYRTENVAPYAIGGDKDSDYYAWTPPTGEVVLTIRAYSQDSGQGTELGTTTLRLNVSDSPLSTPTPTPEPTATPTPLPTPTAPPTPTAGFQPGIDLISLHYDHAPDRDDGHSAAADRTILQTEFSCDFIRDYTTPVAGAYGENANTYRPDSEAVMATVFNPCGGFINAHRDWPGAVALLVSRWSQILTSGGEIWVKEGGQSDITADVVREIKIQFPAIDTRTRIHVIQHSVWNENQTTDADLAYVRQETNYIKIRDANSYLNRSGGDNTFEQAALAHPLFGPSWQSAFNYYNPDNRLDFSDTGELMYILGLGELNIDQFRQRYLD
ncbi:MAG: hypothetical protein HC921_09650 [Synechococcaceae cyanobacterium SM2_3_1]|nr:hypothetical protein [Synechococcaceae cyanobacterium SM2_3_1]